MGADELTLSKYEACWLDVSAAEGGGYTSSVKLSGGRDYSEPTPINLDEVKESLIELNQEPENYGKLLFRTFFSGRAAEGLALARNADAARPVRLRLRLPPNARFLHTLRWEWLYDPRSQTALAAAPTFALSRLLSTPNPAPEPVATRPLRILVVIANPDNLGELGLEQLVARDERQRIEAALGKVSGQVEYKFLEGRATVQNIRDCLEQGGFHVLHVLAHGYFEDKGYLVLEDDNGKCVWVDEGNFGDVLLGQKQLRLVVLAACLTSSMSPARAFAGLAPALVVRGVPAVVAMQGAIEVGAAQAFVQYFYRHLGRNGVVDAAVNYARYRLYLDGQLRGVGQWGVPVLFMNTEEGQLYYPAPAEEDADLPEELRKRFFDVLHEFVDREDQQKVFHELVRHENNRAERILFTQGIPGMGKTWFIHQCTLWCANAANNVATREIDFQFDVPDYLATLDKLAGEDDAGRFEEYRTLVSQKTAGDRQRAYEPGNQAVITQAFFRCLAAQPAPGPVVFFVDHLHDAAQDLRDWFWKVFLPQFQGRRYALDHVTLVVTGRAIQEGLDDPRWLHILERTELKPLDLENFLKFARKRNVKGLSEEDLTVTFRTLSLVARNNPEFSTPYYFCLHLKDLEQQQQEAQRG